MPRPQPPELLRVSAPASVRAPLGFPHRPARPPAPIDGEPLTLADIDQMAAEAIATIDHNYPELQHAV